MNFFLGQIDIFGFNFAPVGWALCSGTLVPVSQNTALFSLLGTTYGGNGSTTFGLPDLRSRTPMMVGPQTVLGEMAGTENVTLNTSELAAHTHPMAVNTENATVRNISNGVFAQATDGTNPLSAYVAPAGDVMLNPQTVSMVGGSQAHWNIQPCLAVNFCIATSGTYPARN